MGVGREEDKLPYRHFGVAVASYKAPTMSMEQWQQFQVMAPQLVPSRKAELDSRNTACVWIGLECM